MCYMTLECQNCVYCGSHASTASTLLDTVNVVSCLDKQIIVQRKSLKPSQKYCSKSSWRDIIVLSVQEYRHLLQKSYNAKKHACVRITDDFF